MEKMEGLAYQSVVTSGTVLVEHEHSQRNIRNAPTSGTPHPTQW